MLELQSSVRPFFRDAVTCRAEVSGSAHGGQSVPRGAMSAVSLWHEEQKESDFRYALLVAYPQEIV